MPPLALIRPCQRGASAWIALPEAADWPVIGVLSPTFLVPLKLVVVFVPPPPQATASRVPAIPTANSLVSRNTSLLLGLAALAAPVYISGPALRHAPRAPRPAPRASRVAPGGHPTILQCPGPLRNVFETSASS